MTKHGTFDPTKSQVSMEAQLNWLRSPISGDLQEIPGIGPKNAQHLQDKHIHTTHQLIGEYMKMKGKNVDPKDHAQRFYEHIQEYGLDSHRSGIVDAIASKVSMWVPGMYDSGAYASSGAAESKNLVDPVAGEDDAATTVCVATPEDGGKKGETATAAPDAPALDTN